MSKVTKVNKKDEIMKCLKVKNILLLALCLAMTCSAFSKELTDVEFVGYKVTHHMGAIV